MASGLCHSEAQSGALTRLYLVAWWTNCVQGRPSQQRDEVWSSLLRSLLLADGIYPLSPLDTGDLVTKSSSCCPCLLIRYVVKVRGLPLCSLPLA